MRLPNSHDSRNPMRWEVARVVWAGARGAPATQPCQPQSASVDKRRDLETSRLVRQLEMATRSACYSGALASGGTAVVERVMAV